MGRKEQRIKNKLEKNPIKECLSIQKKFYPRLFNRFNEVADPRNSSYIDYSNRPSLLFVDNKSSLMVSVAFSFFSSTTFAYT